MSSSKCGHSAVTLSRVEIKKIVGLTLKSDSMVRVPSISKVNQILIIFDRQMFKSVIKTSNT